MAICDKTVGHKDECTVLMTLFLGTQQGDGWLPGCKDGWGKENDYCDWNGITCDDKKHVTKIYLGSCGLTGYFPTPSIFTLPFLEKIQMPRSQGIYQPDKRALKGPLPKDLHFATSLKSLELYGNNFNGVLSGLSALTSLEILDIHFNYFSGPLPDMSNSASTLHYVSVANNHLTGTIPTSWNKLTLLDTLGLAFNEFKGSLGCVRHMPNLNVVYARNNQFTTFGTDLSPVHLPGSSTCAKSNKCYVRGTYVGQLTVVSLEECCTRCQQTLKKLQCGGYSIISKNESSHECTFFADAQKYSSNSSNMSCSILPAPTPKPTPNPTPKPTTPALFGNGVLVLDLDRNRFTCAELNKIPKTLPALKTAGGCTSDWPRQNKNTCCIAQPGTCDHKQLSKYPNCVNKTTL
jgi:hypothetical protein